MFTFVVNLQNHFENGHGLIGFSTSAILIVENCVALNVTAEL